MNILKSNIKFLPIHLIWLLIPLFLLGCAADNSNDDEEKQTEIAGVWECGDFGPGPHTLSISDSTIKEKTTNEDFEVVFQILSFDDGLNQLKTKVSEIVNGSPPYGVGTIFFMSYTLLENETKMHLYFSTSDYLEPTGGTEGIEYFVYQKTE